MSNFSKGSGAPLWAWLLLSTLLAPGAWSLLSEEEELLVELHNYYRGQVSPSASAMLPLVSRKKIHTFICTMANIEYSVGEARWLHG